MPRNTDRPLNREEQLFIRHYVRERDIERAAKKARLKTGEGLQYYKRAHVRQDIDRRLQVIEMEQAKIDAADIDRRDQMTDDYLEAALKSIIELDPKEYGHIKLKALGLGFVVRGKIRQGNTVILNQTADSGSADVHIYRSTFSAPAPTSSPAPPVAAAAKSGSIPPAPPPPAPPHNKMTIRVY